MTPITWKESVHALGHDVMDATHREFVNLVNAAAMAVAEDVPIFFATLVRHTEEHFAREAALMESTNCPSKAEHLAEHKKVLGEMAMVARSLSKGRTSFARAYVSERLPEWFFLHAATMDSALAAHLRDRSVLSAPLPESRNAA